MVFCCSSVIGFFRNYKKQGRCLHVLLDTTHFKYLSDKTRSVNK
jgi:hypothetical protein